MITNARTLLSLLLLTVCTLLLSCTSQPGQPSWRDSLSFLESVADVELRVDGTAALRKYAPEAIALIDAPTLDAAGNVVAPPDGVITLAEVKAVVAAAQDPAKLTWLLLMARGIAEARQGRG